MASWLSDSSFNSSLHKRYTLIMQVRFGFLFFSFLHQGVRNVIEHDLQVSVFNTNSTMFFGIECKTTRATQTCGAEFLLNSTTIAELRYEDNHCYKHNRICTMEACQCSKSCNRFNLTYELPQLSQCVVIGCIVILKNDISNTTYRSKITKIYNKRGVFEYDYELNTQIPKYDHITTQPNHEQDSTEEDVNKHIQECISWILFAFFESCVIIVCTIVARVVYIKGLPIKKNNRTEITEMDTKMLLLRKEDENAENTMLEELKGKFYPNATECSTCTNETAIIFCETCKRFFCQHCNQHHLNISDKAHIFKQIKLIESQGSSKCMMCNSNDTVKVCTECKKSLCTNCGCDKENHVQFVRYFVSEMSGKGCPDCRVVVPNNQVNHKSDVKIPKDKIPTRISGLSVVDESSFAIADSNNKTLKVFKDNSWYKIGLSSEPRNMTSLGDGKVALSFPYEKLITIYNLKKPGRKIDNTIHLHDIGRPYNLAYNDGHFAVEISECDDGHIVIIDKDGNEIAKIETACFHAYFTGHTMRLGLNYSKELVYISAMSKKTVTCLDFAGNTIWSFEIPSPRGLAVIYSNLNEVKILMVSKRGNAIYFLNPNTNEDQILMSGKNIMKPRYIAYNPHTHDLYVTVLGNDDEEQVTIFNLQYQMD